MIYCAWCRWCFSWDTDFQLTFECACLNVNVNQNNTDDFSLLIYLKFCPYSLRYRINNQGCLFRSSSSSSSSVAANSHYSVSICFLRTVPTAKYAQTSFFNCQEENNKKHIYNVYISKNILFCLSFTAGITFILVSADCPVITTHTQTDQTLGSLHSLLSVTPLLL